MFLTYIIDPDFIDQTLLLLSDVVAKRSKPLPAISRAEPQSQSPASPVTPLDCPFNFILTNAMIPVALAAHFDAHHPHERGSSRHGCTVSPRNSSPSFAPYTSGNRNAEVLTNLKTVWRDDALPGCAGGRSHVIIFGNTRTRTGEMGVYLSEHGVSNVVVTGQGCGARTHGSNKHLAGFLRALPGKHPGAEPEVCQEAPRVLLSMSLLARGLDFDRSVSHVFVLEAPGLLRISRIARGALLGRAGVGGWSYPGGAAGAARGKYARCASGSLR